MLLTPTQRIQVLLAAAPATNQPPIMASWADLANDASTLTPGSLTIATSGVTAVDVVAAPATGFLRQLKYLSVFNADTASVTLTVQVLDGAAVRLLGRIVLPVNSKLEYVQDAGFRVLNSEGAVLGSGGGGGGGGVTSVSGTAPIVSSGGATPAISITAATPAAAGSLSAADKAKLDGVASGINAGTATGRVATWNHVAGRWEQGADAEDSRGNLRDVPVAVQDGAYTFSAADRGRKIIKTGATAPVWTIAPALPVGMTVVLRSANATGSITVARGAGVVLRRAGVATDANATLAPWGEALLHCEGVNTWVISGTGLS